MVTVEFSASCETKIHATVYCSCGGFLYLEIGELCPGIDGLRGQCKECGKVYELSLILREITSEQLAAEEKAKEELRAKEIAARERVRLHHEDLLRRHAEDPKKLLEKYQEERERLGKLSSLEWAAVIAERGGVL